MKLKNYVALDVETANAKRNSICSIGLAKFVDGKLIETFYSLINPQDEFNKINISIHGIKPEDVINSPSFPEILPKIIEFIDNNTIIAHSASFDIGVINAVYKKYNLKQDEFNYVCTYKLAKRLLPNLISYKLSYLSNYFNIELEHHQALSDAIAVGLIFNELTKLDNNNTLYIAKNGYNNIVVKDNELSGYTFTFTGKLLYYTRAEASHIVMSHGANVEKNVTRKTNCLVVGEQDFKVVGEDGYSAKMKKAVSLLESGQQIEILTENDFIKLITI
ncbi:DNA polymerase III subunit epsilon [Streptococcus gallolyticus]|uniref:exonuclease domain-containing protein n=1 Tax=Streptococcus TaxID=1301 RepID=UPI000E41EC03|nr:MULTISPECIES: exonuclease domain-containing protein [Streptococcus]RGB46355.1 DNA polymerase III subunit epsilon [Streptococcus gallolyticus]